MSETKSSLSPLVELFSYGIVVGTPRQRPLLLLKGKAEGEVLPVWLSPLEATVAVSGNAPTPQGSVLVTVLKLLEKLKARVSVCEFVELVGGHQMVDLLVETDNGPMKVRARADESMALSLASQARFFARREFMEHCRARQADQVEIQLHMAGEGEKKKRGPNILLN